MINPKTQSQYDAVASWDSVKNDFKKAYESSKDGFLQARQWVSEKIAP